MNSSPSYVPSGFEERQHTADIAIYIWSDTRSGLFIQAAKGMYALLKPECSSDGMVTHTTISLQVADTESLLVLFLSELLYFYQEKRILYDGFQLELDQNQLYARLEGRGLESTEREIKAVTYSELDIVDTGQHFTTIVVFDI